MFALPCFVKGREPGIISLQMEYNDPESKQSALLLGEQATQFYFSASTHLLHPMESCQGESNLSKQDMASDKILPTPCTSERRGEAIDIAWK